MPVIPTLNEAIKLGLDFTAMAPPMLPHPCNSPSESKLIFVIALSDVSFTALGLKSITSRKETIVPSLNV